MAIIIKIEMISIFIVMAFFFAESFIGLEWQAICCGVSTSDSSMMSIRAR